MHARIAFYYEGVASNLWSVYTQSLRAYHSTAVAPRSELPTQRRGPTSENRSLHLSTYIIIVISAASIR